MRVVMIAGRGDSTVYMYNGLKDHFDIFKVIVEEKPNKRMMIKRRIRRLGFWKVLGQLIFIVYSKFLCLGSKMRIQELKTTLNLSSEEIDNDKILRVHSVNSEETLRILKEIEPDVIVVNGTRIISKDVLDHIDSKFVNTHLGITPKYRGVHGGYWALANDDRSNFGTTVHLVDSGIDTGGVLYQKTTKPSGTDNFCTYPLHQIAIGIELMRQALTDFGNDQVKVMSIEQESTLWYHPDIVTYLKNWITKGVK